MIVNIQDSYQLSSMQQGMLFNSLYAQQSGVDIEQVICTLDELDVCVFQEAWCKVIEQHAVLRTSFDWVENSEPLQYVHKQVTISALSYLTC